MANIRFLDQVPVGVYNSNPNDGTSNSFPYTGSAQITGSLNITGSLSNGFNIVASGSYSHAEGLSTVASGDYQHVQGAYNISSSEANAFIIGNGTDNSNRSNLVFASGSNFQIPSGSLRIGTTIIASAILQVDSTTRGFLPPRMTNANRTSITSPAIGLMVYCTDAIGGSEGVYVNKSTGWVFIG